MTSSRATVLGLIATVASVLLSGRTPARATENKACVMLSITPKTPTSAARVKEALDKLRERGFQVELKKFESMTCTTSVPPKRLGESGVFITACYVDQAGQIATVQVFTKTENAMIPIETLHPLAEKMKSRF